MARVTKVESRARHRLYLEFTDGTAGEVDLTDRLFGPVFLPLRDEAFFSLVSIDGFGVPCWPNGADLAPDALYDLVRAQSNAAPAVD